MGFKEDVAYSDTGYYWQSRFLNTCKNWVATFNVKMSKNEWYGIDHWYYTLDDDNNLVHNTLINLDECADDPDDDSTMTCFIKVGPMNPEVTGATEVYQNIAGFAMQEGDYGVIGCVS